MIGVKPSRLILVLTLALTAVQVTTWSSDFLVGEPGLLRWVMYATLLAGAGFWAFWASSILTWISRIGFNNRRASRHQPTYQARRAPGHSHGDVM